MDIPTICMSIILIVFAIGTIYIVWSSYDSIQHTKWFYYEHPEYSRKYRKMKMKWYKEERKRK